MKIITGIKRCGKSFLLRTLYKQVLMKKGMKAGCFIEIDLEKVEFATLKRDAKMQQCSIVDLRPGEYGGYL